MRYKWTNYNFIAKGEVSYLDNSLQIKRDDLDLFNNEEDDDDDSTLNY